MMTITKRNPVLFTKKSPAGDDERMTSYIRFLKFSQLLVAIPEYVIFVEISILNAG